MTGPQGPFSASAVLINRVSPTTVHVLVPGRSGPPSLARLFVRVRRGNALVLSASFAIAYPQDLEFDLGTPETPVLTTDYVEFGTSEYETEATRQVLP